MNASNFIAAYRQSTPATSLAQLAALVAFEPGKLEFGYPTDSNLEFRAAVVAALLPDFSLADYELIQVLFAEEMKCETTIWRHDSLYQLCFYLYELGQLLDTFRLYEAKFKATNMDVGILLDREMMTVRHEVPDVIRYVEAAFLEQSLLQTQYPTILEELYGLLEHPDYNSVEDYRTFIRGYFYGHEDEDSTEDSTDTLPPASLSGYEPRPKSWWKFW
jgi:hypothetical protein